MLKVHSRCDLACDHCYVYEHQDQSWLRRPRVMTLETARAAAVRIAEHAAAHDLSQVRIILHGGEPLLVGVPGLRAILTQLCDVIAPVTRLDLRVQSNGVQLTEATAELFTEFNVRVGISLDGGAAANDRHRRFPSGASSHAQVLRALTLLRQPRYRPLYAGILATIDIENDPIEVYEALLAEEPPRVDLLLPHATHEHPPPRRGEYGKWLLRIHDRWQHDDQPMRVRLFDSLVAARASGPSQTEAVGLDPVDIAVIETDGEWEQADTLKTAYDGAPATGLDVFHHSVNEVAALPEVAARQQGLAGLCETCQACPVVRQCGGGLYAHRFRAGNGFDNPSVFCEDLKELIAGINDRTPVSVTDRPTDPDLLIDPDMPAALLAELGSGYGDADAIGFLAQTQLAFTRALIVNLAAEWGTHGPAGAGWQLLSELDRRALVHRDARADAAVARVLAHPYLRPWALDVLAGSASPHELGAIAGSAAIHAGAAAELPVPVTAGRVFLPTLGTAVFAADHDGPARLVVTADGFTLRRGDETITVHDGQSRSDRWLSAHRLALPGLTLLLEDQDPSRHRHPGSATEPLSAAEVAAWGSRVGRAWPVILADGARYAAGLAVGLRAITPLAADPDRPLRSSTARDAFGAVGASPADPDALAVMVVHEFQHSKLGAVLDLCDLLDPQAQQRIRVGWRPDPRPLEGVLQGCYAHLAVCDLWRTRSHRDHPAAVEAAGHHRQYRDWTAAALEALAGSAGLTPLGARFVDRMARTLTALS